MTQKAKLITRILSGTSDKKISFAEAAEALEYAGYLPDGGKGSHRVFRHSDGRHFSLPFHGDPIKPVYVKAIRAILYSSESGGKGDE